MEYLEDINRWFKHNNDYILNSLSELIQIKTENLPPGGNEKPGQEYIYNKVTKYIPEKNIDMFEIYDIEGIRKHPLFFPTTDGVEKDYRDRPNLVAKLEGNGGERSLVFSGHIDTMPTYNKKWKVFENPYSGKVKDGKMYGRGSADMKAGTISGFLALKCLKDIGVRLKGDVYAESIVDEENGGVNGTIAARLRNPYIDFGIIPEPTNQIVGVESVGGSDWKISVIEEGAGGIEASEKMKNPIYKLKKVVSALEDYDKKIGKIKPSNNYNDDMRIRLLTYQFSSGGSSYIESGAVPTEGHIYFWLEAFANIDEEKYRKDFLDFLYRELGKYEEFKDSFPKVETVIRFLYGHTTDTTHPAMESIKKAHKDCNQKYEIGGMPYSTDAFAFKRTSNTDVVIMGPTGKNPHGIDEYVEVDSVLKLIKIMVLTAIDYCNK
jgi:acetylornithine deacetylase